MIAETSTMETHFLQSLTSLQQRHLKSNTDIISYHDYIPQARRVSRQRQSSYFRATDAGKQAKDSTDIASNKNENKTEDQLLPIFAYRSIVFSHVLNAIQFRGWLKAEAATQSHIPCPFQSQMHIPKLRRQSIYKFMHLHISFSAKIYIAKQSKCTKVVNNVDDPIHRSRHETGYRLL